MNHHRKKLVRNGPLQGGREKQRKVAVGVDDPPPPSTTPSGVKANNARFYQKRLLASIGSFGQPPPLCPLHRPRPRRGNTCAACHSPPTAVSPPVQPATARSPPCQPSCSLQPPDHPRGRPHAGRNRPPTAVAAPMQPAIDQPPPYPPQNAPLSSCHRRVRAKNAAPNAILSASKFREFHSSQLATEWSAAE